jgi:hypothetical protein
MIDPLLQLSLLPDFLLFVGILWKLKSTSFNFQRGFSAFFSLAFSICNTCSLVYIFNSMHMIVSYDISVLEVATDFEKFSKL